MFFKILVSGDFQWFCTADKPVLTELAAAAALGSALSCSQIHFPVHGSPVSLRCSEAQIIALGSRSAAGGRGTGKGFVCGQSPSE